MDRESLNQHLSQITTAWTVLARAHQPGEPGNPEAVPEAQASARAALIQRYGTAVYRYLLGALRDADAADEVFQEFALRLVRGDFHRADPGKGRFRDFLKTSLFRLIVDSQRRRKRSAIERPWSALAGSSGSDENGRDRVAVEPSVPPEGVASSEQDQQFLDVWRGELLASAWDALARIEQFQGQPYHTVLRLRTEHPELRSADLAERLSSHLGKPLNAGWVRKKLMQAREIFTDALLEGVARSLADPSRENVEEELIELGLLEHCRDALERSLAPRPE